MRHFLTTCTPGPLLLAIAATVASAQVPDQAGQANNPEPSASAAPAPLPGDEVMHPTQVGLKFTPALARAFALGWMNQNLGESMELSPDQSRRLSEALGKSILESSRQNRQVTEQFFEGLIETMMKSEGPGKLNAEDAKKLAQRAQPIIPLWQDMLDDLPGVTREILTPSQQKELEKVVASRQRKLDRFADTMDKWAGGGYDGKDRPLEDFFDPNSDEPDPPSPAAGPSSRPAPTRSSMQARQRANWQMRLVGPTEWQRFIMMARVGLKFTPEQSAKADQLFAEYKAKASAVMTPEWKRALRQNRTRDQIQWELQNIPKGPWLFHLQREYDQAVAPLKQMRRELYAKVLALATDEQRKAMLDDISTRANPHGLSMTDVDRALLMSALKMEAAP